MPSLVVDAVAVTALVVMLAVAFRHPAGWVEALTGLLAAGAVLLTGGVSVLEARDAVTTMLPVVLFLVFVLVVAQACAAEGLFAALGAAVARRSRHDPRRMLLLTFVAAALTTAALSLDATVVLLTPVVAAAAVGAALRPISLACVRLANSASLLLPVSNLTNLLALRHVELSFVGWAALMAPVWVAVIGVEYAAIRLLHRRDLRAATPDGDGASHPVPPVPVVVVALMLAGFAAASPLGIEPFWPAAVGAAVLALHSLARRTSTPREVVRGAGLPFAFFVLCLAVVVAALGQSFLGDLVAGLVPSGHGLVALLLVALLATVLANLVNNLPATLLLVPLLAPGGTLVVLAGLVGLNVGSGLTYPGSLANLLWRRVLPRGVATPGPRDFHVLAAVATPVAVTVAVVVLWGSAHVTGLV